MDQQQHYSLSSSLLPASTRAESGRPPAAPTQQPSVAAQTVTMASVTSQAPLPPHSPSLPASSAHPLRGQVHSCLQAFIITVPLPSRPSFQVSVWLVLQVIQVQGDTVRWDSDGSLVQNVFPDSPLSFPLLSIPLPRSIFSHI